MKGMTAYLAAFVLWVFGFESARDLLAPWLPAATQILTRTSLPELALQHIAIVTAATALALATALLLAVLVRLRRSDEWKRLALAAGSIGETVPSAAVIALAVPVLGYGNVPCMLALYLYAILPVVRNAIIGMESTPAAVQEAGTALGMTRRQQLRQLDLPLAVPAILAGARTALVVNISAATIGATVGAGGFGVPIIAGIRIYDPVMVLQGSIPVILLALFADRAFRLLSARMEGVHSL